MAKDGYEIPVHTSSTSGSTGTPFSVVQDKIKRSRTIADLQVFGERCGYLPRERMILFRVLSDHLHRSQSQEEKENIFYIDSSDLSDEKLGAMEHSILELEPVIIFSYASTLVELAKYIQSREIREYKVKAVLTAGEGISEENRLLLEKVFGCKVYRRYADMELGILAQDYGDGGNYYLNWGSFYFECLKLDSDEPAEEGEVGRIVITDLFNKAFPMIRYDTGDLGILEKTDDFPVLKDIYGRIRDCVYSVDGRLISPAKISVSMWGMDKIKQWQFIQESEDRYTLKINSDSKIDLSAVIEKLKVILGGGEFNIEYVDEIPVLSSNKRRAVICKLNKDI